MVVVSFSHGKKKIENGEKQTTIRKPRKRKYKSDDMLQLYWKQRSKLESQLLFIVPLESVRRILLIDITEEIAVADGFQDRLECLDWFNTTHKKYIQSPGYVGFDLIKWDYEKRIYRYQDSYLGPVLVAAKAIKSSDPMAFFLYEFTQKKQKKKYLAPCSFNSFCKCNEFQIRKHFNCPKLFTESLTFKNGNWKLEVSVAKSKKDNKDILMSINERKTDDLEFIR